MTGFLYWFRNNVFIYVLLSVAFLNALRVTTAACAHGADRLRCAAGLLCAQEE
jgi:hypothetical protein